MPIVVVQWLDFVKSVVGLSSLFFVCSLDHPQDPKDPRNGLKSGPTQPNLGRVSGTFLCKTSN